MTVKTLSRRDLELHSQQLLKNIQKDHIPSNIIIGIATGGVYISRTIKDNLVQQNWNGKYYEIKLSRKSTETKKKLKIKMFLTKLPYFILNQLRKLEVFIFENFKAEKYDSSKEDRVVLSDALIKDIKNSNSILLVDDAIDTGSTILAIKNIVKRINPSIDVKVTVLTVTHKKPYIEPDYTLYRRVLIRCPWAEDYKGGDKIE